MTATAPTREALRYAGVTAPQARELAAVAATGRPTGLVGSLRVVHKLEELGLVERVGAYFSAGTVATEAGREALRVLEGGKAYVEERGRKALAKAYAERCADGTERRYMLLRAGRTEEARELLDNPRPATDEELRTFADLRRSDAVHEAKARTIRGHKRAAQAWADVDAIEAILAERRAELARQSADLIERVDAALEAPEFDEEPTVVVEGARYYAGRVVHLGAGDGRAVCGANLVVAIDTTAPLSCQECGTRTLEAAGVPAEEAGELAATTIDVVLAGRAAAEAPELELPGVAAAAVEAALGGRGPIVGAHAWEDRQPPHRDEEVLIVIPCSGAKLDRPAPAGELYTGSLHREARKAADALAARTPGARVVVLSALYGLLELDRVVEPYNVTVGDAGAIDAGRLAQQVPARTGLVVALTPNGYTDLLAQACRALEVELEAPLAGCRGNGEQRGRYGAIARGELLP